MSDNKIRYLLGVDLEGINQDLLFSGLNLKVDRVIEIGAVLWDLEEESPVQFISELIDEKDRLPISEEVQELTGIKDSTLKKWGLRDAQIKATLTNLSYLMKKASFIVAHNGRNYDHPMLKSLFFRFDVPFPSTPWIDTSVDVEFPSKIKLKSLAALEHAHGFVNPFPHRALTDVLSMLKILVQYDINRTAELAISPKVRIVAKLIPPNWKDVKEVERFNRQKNKVAKANFKWSPQEKKWTKDIPQLLIDEGKLSYDFDWSLDKEKKNF